LNVFYQVYCEGEVPSIAYFTTHVVYPLTVYGQVERSKNVVGK